MLDAEDFPLKLNEEFSVRQATLEDVPRIGEIWLEGVEAAFLEDTPVLPTQASLFAQLSKLVLQQTEDFKFWLCIDNQNFIVGWSTVQPFDTTPLESARNSYGYISTYMSAVCRGRGIGGIFLSFVIDYCKKYTNVLYVIGIQARSNTPSVKVAEKVGFRDLGQLPLLEGTVPTSIIVCPTGKDLAIDVDTLRV